MVGFEYFEDGRVRIDLVCGSSVICNKSRLTKHVQEVLDRGKCYCCDKLGDFKKCLFGKKVCNKCLVEMRKESKYSTRSVKAKKHSSHRGHLFGDDAENRLREWVMRFIEDRTRLVLDLGSSRYQFADDGAAKYRVVEIAKMISGKFGKEVKGLLA